MRDAIARILVLRCCFAALCPASAYDDAELSTEFNTDDRVGASSPWHNGSAPDSPTAAASHDLWFNFMAPAERLDAWRAQFGSLALAGGLMAALLCVPPPLIIALAWCAPMAARKRRRPGTG